MFIFPGFPKVNSPLQVKFYVRLVVNVSSSVVVERTVLTSVLDSVLQNLTSEFGVGFSGKPSCCCLRRFLFSLPSDDNLCFFRTSLYNFCERYVKFDSCGPFINYRKTLPLLSQVCDVSNNQS